MRGNRKIRRRKRFFIGCEGESERGYAAFLQVLAESKNLAIHLDTQTLGNAGDPLEMVKLAVVKIANGERNGRPSYKGRFLILDTDRLGQNQHKDAQMEKIAANNNLKLVKQNCCIEAVLLRHFDGKEASNPPSTDEALKQLRLVWPNYKKATAAQDLAKKFNLNNVQRAAAQPIQSDLKCMLEIIGLLNK